MSKSKISWFSKCRKAYKFVVYKVFPWLSIGLVILFLIEPVRNLIAKNAEEQGMVLIGCLLFLVSNFLLYIGDNKGQFAPFVMQNEIVDLVFSKVKKNGKLKIIIYTGFSFFSVFDNLMRKYSKLSTIKIDILVRDPDAELALLSDKKDKFSDKRTTQFDTGISHIKSNESIFNIKFYKNEPWIRGINVDDKEVFISPYTVKTEEKEILYSGSEVPWTRYPNNSLSNGHKMIDDFNALFDNVWEKCTKYKNLVLDLQGTIFESKKLLEDLTDLPEAYIKSKYPKVATETILVFKKRKEKKIESVTASLIASIEECTGKKFLLSDFIEWKNAHINIDNYDLEPNKEMKDALLKCKEIYNIILLTNHTKKHTKDIIKKLDLHLVFDSLVTLEDIKEPKPNKDINDYLINTLKLNLPDSIFIGDRKQVDLDYLFSNVLGKISVKEPSILPNLLENLRYSYTYAKMQNRNRDIKFE